MSTKIFDDVARTDVSPAHEEDSFAFLNRVATPYWAKVRSFVDDAFAAYPAEHAPDLRMRFRSRRWSEHAGAWWELYLFTLFRSLDLEVEVHPALPDVATRPDFRIHGIDGDFIVEARHVAAGITSGHQMGQDVWITAPLDELVHPNFMVGVRIVARAPQRPRRAAVNAGVLEWLDGLDPDEVMSRPVQELPRLSVQAGGWRFELEALPVKAEARSRPGRRLVGLYPATGGRDNTAFALRAALKEKAAKYGRPECPFVLAPLITSGFMDTEDVVGALFGTEAVQLSGLDLERVPVVRRRNGFWTSGRGVRGTRISAVLLGHCVLPWTAAKSVPRLWINPAAAHPLPVDLTLPTARLDGAGQLVLSSVERTGADLFGMDSDWPGPEGPFAV